MSHSERIVLYIDSAHRTSGSTTDFTLVLTRPVNKILEVEVIGAEIPYSYYGVQSINNTLVWTSASVSYICHVPPSNYSISQFIIELQKDMNTVQSGWKITYNPQTYKLTFENTTPFTIDLTNSAGTTTINKVIGLTQPTVSGTTVIMPGVSCVSGPRYLLIKSNALTRPKITRSFINSTQDDVLYKMSIQGGPGDILVEKNLYTNSLRYGVRQQLQSIDFRLTDDVGNIIDLNGQDWSLHVNLIQG